MTPLKRIRLELQRIAIDLEAVEDRPFNHAAVPKILERTRELVEDFEEVSRGKPQ